MGKLLYEIFQIFSNFSYKIGTINGKSFVRNFSNFFKFFIQNWYHQWENFCTKFFKFFQIFHTKLVITSMGKFLYDKKKLIENFLF
jgi:hypothetical protein